MKQLFYKEHLIENESVRIAENLEKFLLGIGLEQNDIDHAKTLFWYLPILTTTILPVLAVLLK